MFNFALALALLGHTGMAIGIRPHVLPPATQGFAPVGTPFALSFVLM